MTDKEQELHDILIDKALEFAKYEPQVDVAQIIKAFVESAALTKNDQSKISPELEQKIREIVQDEMTKQRKVDDDISFDAEVSSLRTDVEELKK